MANRKIDKTNLDSKTTGDVAAHLGVSTATVRNWLTEFLPFFSEQIRNHKRGVHRRFTDQDVRVLEVIAELSRQSHDYGRIRAHLEDCTTVQQLEITPGGWERIVCWAAADARWAPFSLGMIGTGIALVCVAVATL
jgi:DNA-binding transcriptional MerR regulator